MGDTHLFCSPCLPDVEDEGIEMGFCGDFKEKLLDIPICGMYNVKSVIERKHRGGVTYVYLSKE